MEPLGIPADVHIVTDPQRLQQYITFLYRDYTSLHFNIIHLHRTLTAGDGTNLRDQLTHTLCICYSSAFGILKHTIHFGEVDSLYYLWDGVHTMIAYAAMVIPKLLAQGIDGPTTSKQEATEILTQAATTYIVAIRSMGNPEPHSSNLGTEIPHSMSDQARLLSNILIKLNAGEPGMEDACDIPDVPIDPDLPWLEDPMDQSSLFYGMRSNYQQFGYNNMNPTISNTEHTRYCLPLETAESGMLVDEEYLRSSYLDAGLLPWDEPGILAVPC